jgi:predicted phage terminase large subunit-like protein
MIEAAARLQGRMVQALRRERSAGELRPHRAELGYRQQGDRAERLQRLHDLGHQRQEPYLLGLLRKRLEYPALKRAVREQQSLFNASVVLIEDKASGTQLIQELITDGFQRVTRYQPDCDKIMRMHAQTAVIENGFVWIPETAPWLAEYLQRQSTCSNIWANHRRGMLLMH